MSSMILIFNNLITCLFNFSDDNSRNIANKYLESLLLLPLDGTNTSFKMCRASSGTTN